MRRQPAYCSCSSSKLRRLLGGLRLSQHPGAVLHPGPAPEHRLLSLALLPPAPGYQYQYGSQVASLLQQLCQGAQVALVVSSLVALKKQYRGQVEEGRGRVGVESFLALQTAAVREQVGVVPGSGHLALVKHLALFKHLALLQHSTHLALSRLHFSTTVPHHCPMQVSELSGTSPHSPQLQTCPSPPWPHRAILNSQVGSGIHMETLEMGVIYWGVQIWSKR